MRLWVLFKFYGGIRYYFKLFCVILNFCDTFECDLFILVGNSVLCCVVLGILAIFGMFLFNKIHKFNDILVNGEVLDMKVEVKYLVN